MQSPFRSDLFAGQAGIITGGSSGIGFGIAEALLAHGAKVTITGRNKEKMESAVNELGEGALGVTGDVRKEEEVKGCLQQHMDKFGRVDFLVNNAAGNFLCPLEKMSENAFRSVTDIIMLGTFHWSQAVLPAMQEAKYGRIVNIGTTYSYSHGAMVAHSGAGKAAIVNLSRSIALEWAKYGIRCNIVAPGPVEGTEGVRRLMGGEKIPPQFAHMMPVPRFVKPQEVAWLVSYLCSNASDYINGALVPIDGGLSYSIPGLLPFSSAMPQMQPA
jgi:NAD(P)-dependent dehydrogenase (short-subunit alcohol dehydrogenase family)